MIFDEIESSRLNSVIIYITAFAYINISIKMLLIVR